jgi:hypothetical protein
MFLLAPPTKTVSGSTPSASKEYGMRVSATVHGVALGAVALMMAGAGSARAEQMVLFDITYTHTSDRNAHHEVKAPELKQPDNWTAPINYAGGTLHFYQEVETKPSPRVTIIDFCFISNPGYGCIETMPYTKTGVNETTRSMAAGGDWYQRDQIKFAQKMTSIELVIKDPVTYTNGCPNQDCTPSKMRFVATIVSPGGTYQKPAPGPGFGGGGGAGDGGVTAPDAGAASPDAAPAKPDATAGDAQAPEKDTGGTPPAEADAGTGPTPPAEDPKPPKVDAAAPAAPKPPKADAAAPKPPADNVPSGDSGSSGGSAGCSFGAGSQPGGIASVMMMALLLVVRRARRR